MQSQLHVRMMCDAVTTVTLTTLSFDVSFLENACEYLHELYIARNHSP